MRVVSLCPSLTETIFALGAQDQLVGRTRFCVEPSGSVERVESMGGTKDPNLERIIALQPDLVLMNAEENRREDAEALGAAGVRLHSSFPRHPADVPALLREWGRLLGVKSAGDRLAHDLEVELEKASPSAGSSPRSFAFLIWRRPWMAAGKDTYASALLEHCGGQNVFREDAGYPTFELEHLRALHPERLLLTSEPYRFRQTHVDEVREATGIPRERIQLVDGQALTWHGVRTASGLTAARAALRKSSVD
ncbi:MAG: iron complex transport system substrate-binding protein [Planctomycetota bacterium]|jgi:iron complex transport system substrate-binding protein